MKCWRSSWVGHTLNRISISGSAILPVFSVYFFEFLCELVASLPATEVAHDGQEDLQRHEPLLTVDDLALFHVSRQASPSGPAPSHQESERVHPIGLR